MKRIDRGLPEGVMASRKDGRTMARILFICAGAVALLEGPPASAAWVNINPPRGTVILRINYTGTPTVTFTVPVAQLGNGTPIVGTIPGVAALEFEMSVQSQNFGPNLTATMTYTAPATINSGGNSIPITTISWTSAAIAGAPGGTTLIPGGTFAAGSHAIVSITSTGGNTYAGGALTFRFANAAIYPQGTYGPAAVNYTASRNP